ncbi:MAG: hypothetical protein DHS20C17_29970 [Cyclobacteriaceae bacterium]|nr:MAG: hypothetical protein DHS20C17_29970 [Cyclobacteriaceae bacterium]
MKLPPLLIFILLYTNPCTFAQGTEDKTEQQIVSLVDQYALARAEKDVDLLNSILMSDVDQLVSNGEWRRGMHESMEGMLHSSTRQPGSRSLTVEKVRFLTPECAIADARYQIDNADGTQRKMWSTFIAVYHQEKWKIAAIRNMLPAK